MYWEMSIYFYLKLSMGFLLYFNLDFNIYDYKTQKIIIVYSLLCYNILWNTNWDNHDSSGLERLFGEQGH